MTRIKSMMTMGLIICIPFCKSSSHQLPVIFKVSWLIIIWMTTVDEAALFNMAWRDLTELFSSLHELIIHLTHSWDAPTDHCHHNSWRCTSAKYPPGHQQLQRWLSLNLVVLYESFHNKYITLQPPNKLGFPQVRSCILSMAEQSLSQWDKMLHK